MDGGFSDCTGTCEPLMDHAQHYIGGTDLNNMDGANSARYGANGGFTAQVEWQRVAQGRVPGSQEGRAFAMPWEWRDGVSCHDIAAIWIAFFSRCKRYHC